MSQRKAMRSHRSASESWRCSPGAYPALCILLFLGCSPILCPSALAQKPSGRGAMSAQQIRKSATGPLVTTPGAPVCPEYAAGSAITPPAYLFSVGGVLEVTLNLETDVDSTGAQRYCYVTSTGLISPTLHVNPGDTLLIHFYNQVPAGLVPATPMAVMRMDNMASMQNMPSAANTPTHNLAAGIQLSLPPTTLTTGSPAPTCITGPMSASTSNLHFHGLNVSPLCGSDEVVNTLIEPGQEFDYTIQIPSNEPPGLYWYHPHPHGFSEGQVQGGATGAIIVEGLQLQVPSLAGMPEQTMVIRDQLVPLSLQNDNNVPAWDLSMDYVPVLFPSYTPAQVPVTPSQQQLWRVLNSAADTILNLQYVIGGSAQMVTLVSIDGVPLTGGPIQQSSILLGPGARAEFVVTTPTLGQTAQLITQNIDTGPDGDFDPTRPIASIVASNSAPTLPVVQVVSRTALARSLVETRRFAALVSTPSVAQRTLYFSEVLQDPSNPAGPTNFYITQDGETPQLFTMGQAPNITVHSGTVETWVVQNRAMENHIFHIHQIHFQVLAVNGVAVSDPAIRDTVQVPYWTGSGPYPSVTLAMDFRDPNIIGTFVYHCHILGHEDGGMMGSIQVLPPGTGSTTVISSSASSVTPVSTTTLQAIVTSGVMGGSTPTGQVQFQANGVDVGSPVTVTGGIATLPASGSLLQNGANDVIAFYLGDSNYAESLSNAVTVNDAPFGITGSPSTLFGAGGNAGLQVVVAGGYTNAVTLSCSVPSTMTGSSCAVYPATVSGGGPATLAITTPTAKTSSAPKQHPFALPVSTVAFSALLLPFLRRKRNSKILSSLIVVFALAALLAMSSCTPGTTKTSFSSAVSAGTYNVTVTGVGAGTPTYTATTTVPITVQ